MKEIDKYADLAGVLEDAFEQASEGKGKERHATGEAFRDQPIFWIEENFPSFQLGQAVKKIYESQRLDVLPACAELRGAIVYLAAHIIFLEGD